MKAGGSKQVRCAIYTRVSTDQGLEQDFNSLDAQGEAWLSVGRCEDTAELGTSTEKSEVVRAGAKELDALGAHEHTQRRAVGHAARTAFAFIERRIAEDLLAGEVHLVVQVRATGPSTSPAVQAVSTVRSRPAAIYLGLGRLAQPQLEVA